MAAHLCAQFNLIFFLIDFDRATDQSGKEKAEDSSRPIGGRFQNDFIKQPQHLHEQEQEQKQGGGLKCQEETRLLGYLLDPFRQSIPLFVDQRGQ